MDYVSMIIGAVIGVPIAALVILFAKALWYGLSGLFLSFFSDLPDLSETWIATFTEPRSDGDRIESNERIVLKQFGRNVWGKSDGLDELDRSFRYLGHLTRNTYLGTYVPIGSKKPSGRGVYQLIVSGNDAEMKGHCLWHDYDTDMIETSPFIWIKKE